MSTKKVSSVWISTSTRGQVIRFYRSIGIRGGCLSETYSTDKLSKASLIRLESVLAKISEPMLENLKECGGVGFYIKDWWVK